MLPVFKMNGYFNAPKEMEKKIHMYIYCKEIVDAFNM